MTEPAELENTATAYDELLVPALFEKWAHHMADAAEVREGDRVLDVACGTGILTRTIAPRVRPKGSVSGLDVNPAMLAVARTRGPDIDWHEGNAESLPFDDEVFDVVVSQFGLMLFSDPMSALTEMYRVLRKGGLLSLAVFDALDKAPAYAAMADVFERVAGRTVGEALRFPFSMGDPAILNSLVSRAGFTDTKITTSPGTARFSSPRHMVFSDVKGWFPFAGIQLEDEQLNAVLHEAEAALEGFVTEVGSVEFEISVHVARAHRPT